MFYNSDGMSNSDVLLTSMTSDDAQQRLASSVAIIPIGAIEQHGPHLPLDTDIYLATCVAVETARNVEGQLAVVCPPLPIGISEHHMGFSGTLSLQHETLYALVRDVVSSLMSHGCRRIVLLNGHAGNSALVGRATQELGASGQARVVGLNYWNMARELVLATRRSEQGGMGHGGEFETSLMLHLRPEDVRLEQVTSFVPVPRVAGEDLDLFSNSNLSMDFRTEELNPAGVIGRPDLATDESGAAWFKASVEGCSNLASELLSLPDKG